MPDEFIISFSFLWAQVPASSCTATCGLDTGGSLVSRLDGEPTTILLNGTTFAGGITPVYRADNMQDGDHQLMGQPMTGIFDEGYFEYVCGWPCSTLSQE